MLICLIFFFAVPATSELYTLSLHDALPIFLSLLLGRGRNERYILQEECCQQRDQSEDHHRHKTMLDRKSTRLNSSHQIISYAVFCLKKKLATDRRSRSRWPRSDRPRTGRRT